MPKENNKMQVDIDTLKKQNVNDLLSIKELYKRIEELGEKITQIKYIDNTLVKKLKKEYENLKKIILDENIQVELSSKIEENNLRLNEINEQFNTIMNEFDVIPQCSLPPKQGEIDNSYKLVLKNNSSEYLILQPTNKGYLKYTFKKGIGDSSASVGVNWELLRLFNVEKCNEIFVWLEPNAVSGTLLKTIKPSDFNGVESNLLPKSTSNNICNKQGITLYELQASQQAEFYIPKVYNNKFSIKYLSNDNRSENVEIYVNNILVKTLNTRNNDITGCYQDIEFEIPFKRNNAGTTQWTLKIINKDTNNKFSFIGFNFESLKDYKGKSIDSYKIYPLKSYFINTIGANDYAIRDLDIGKWCGSYHGGETLLWNKIIWNSTKDFARLEYEKETEFDLITDTSFTIVKNFKIIQQTNINNKAKMMSIFDFNQNGTINMSFALSENTIKARDIYTQMVCSDPNFLTLIYPVLKPITPNGETSFKNTIGNVVQKNVTTGDKITIRHDMFTNTYNTKGSFVVQDSSNSKVYYGVVSNYMTGVVIENINFNKSIDFEINTL